MGAEQDVESMAESQGGAEAAQAPRRPPEGLTDGVPDWTKPDVIQWISVDRIVGDLQNPRTHASRQKMEQLIADVRENGIQEELKIRPSADPGKGILKSGHRRLYAAKAAGEKLVPCLLKPGKVTATEALWDLVRFNEHREDLPCVDKAKAFRTLMREENLSGNQLAKRLNIDPMEVSLLMSLLNLPEDIQQHVNSGAIPLTTGNRISRLPAHLQADVAAQVVAGKLTCAQVEAMLKPERATKKPRVYAFNAGQSSNNVSFKTDRTFHGPDGEAVIVRSLTKDMSVEQVAEVLEAVLQSLPRRVSLQPSQAVG